jgi:hypothetical protein
VLVEEKLHSFVGIVNTQLFKTVGMKILKNRYQRIQFRIYFCSILSKFLKKNTPQSLTLNNLKVDDSLECMVNVEETVLMVDGEGRGGGVS